MSWTTFKYGDRVRQARRLLTGSVEGFRLGAFVCVKWDDGTRGDHYPRNLVPHDDAAPPINLEDVPKAHLVIEHRDFDSSMLSRDCRSYFVEGFGLLDVLGNTHAGVVLEYYDHCGDGKLLPEFTQERKDPA